MNKTVLITGATSGIGLGCARKFAANGDRLILTGRNAQRLEEIRKELTAKGTEVLTLVFDVRDREKATECIENLPAEWKDIDVLVNCSYQFDSMATVAKMKDLVPEFKSLNSKYSVLDSQ
jgi:NADP-dependent 3-hydroxy acid dehydrogenase YdfG